MKKDFEQCGYVLIPDFFRPEEVQSLIQKIKYCHNGHAKGSKLSKGAMTFYSNNYRNSEEIRNFISQPRLIKLLQPLIGPDFWVRWDQAVVKGPGSGEFPWHQDNGYNVVTNQYFQLWIPLTHMNADNGCLWLVPGSHKKRFPHKRVGEHRVYPGEPKQTIQIVAKPGDVVVFSSYMLHKTAPNITDVDRWAYVVEYMDLHQLDPLIRPPFFIVSRDGLPCAELASSYSGRQSIVNWLRSSGAVIKKAGDTLAHSISHRLMH